MKIAIIGPKSSGKSELFAALSGRDKKTYQNKAVVKVRDNRLITIGEVFKSKKITFPEIEYLDVPGGGEKSLGSKMLNSIRPYDCFLAILNGFSRDDPKDQWDNIESDFIITDLAVVEKRLERIALDKKKSKDLVDEEEEKLLNEAKDLLEKNIPLREKKDVFSNPKLKGFEFLSLKPVVYVWNIDENSLNKFKLPDVKKQNQAHIVACVKIERELLELDDEDLKKEFLKDLGINESVLDHIVSTTYKLMDLITFFTADEKEAKGWTIKKGTTALKAAGTVHSDMERGFIKAEVISWEDFKNFRDLKKAKEKGALRLEGKDYIVQDGDLIRFKFKV